MSVFVLAIPFSNASATPTYEGLNLKSGQNHWIGYSAGVGAVGSLTVDEEDDFTAGQLSIGEYTGGAGTVTLSGSGSTITTSASLIVGSKGTGTLNILSGGVLATNAVSVSARIGSSEGGSYVMVDGRWSRIPVELPQLGRFSGECRQ